MLLRGQPPALLQPTSGENLALGSRASTSQEAFRHEKLSIHIAGILGRKEKTKNLHPLASGRIFLLCETGREENLRFLLLRLIDINIKYSGVVLIRLWFSSRSREEKKKEKKKDLLLDQNIFSENILLASSPPPPSPVPALASKAQQCVLGC